MKILQRAGQVLLPLLLVGAAVFFACFVHRFYPIQRWLFWRYAGYWLLCVVWSAACVSAGHLTLKLVLRRPLPLVDTSCVASPTMRPPPTSSSCTQCSGGMGGTEKR
ncbi:MAG TPA: hypothetical protein VFF45_00085 [Bacilli bacterium]|nr:hypothetical protein [Bacilli bacterium]